MLCVASLVSDAMAGSGIYLSLRRQLGFRSSICLV